MNKKALILAEIFYPEKYPINDLYFDLERKGYAIDVFTRNPSYPQDQFYEGFGKTFFSSEKRLTGNIYRSFVFLGYTKSKFIKVTNYLVYSISLFIFLLRFGKKYEKILFYQTGPLSNVFSACVLKFLFSYKIYVWIQDLWPQTLYAYRFGRKKIARWIIENVVSYIYWRCDYFIVSSEGFSKNLAKYNKPITWIPNWLTEFNKIDETIHLEGKYNFIFAGNIGKAQKLDAVVRGFSRIAQEHDAYLHIIGVGSMCSEIKSIVENKKILKIKFYDFLPIEQTVKYLQASDVLILSLDTAEAYKDTIPGKFQFYLQNKKPIFAVTNGVVKTYTEQNKLGLSADPNDIKSVEETFLKFIGSTKEEMKEYAENCWVFNQKMFNKKLLVKRFEVLIFNSSSDKNIIY